jgi:HSP20 family protein
MQQLLSRPSGEGRTFTFERERRQRDARPERPAYDGPPVDIEETADAIFIRAEMPGMAPDDFSVEVTGRRVIIRGIKSEERHEESQGFLQQEREQGEFTRVLDLPAQVDPEAAAAAYRDGVLRLMLPKAPASRAHRIQVASS